MSVYLPSFKHAYTCVMRNDQNKWLHIVPHVSRDPRRKFDLPSRNAWKLKNCSFFWPIKWLIRFSLFRFLFYFISFFLVVDEAAAVAAIAKLVFSSSSLPPQLALATEELPWYFSMYIILIFRLLSLFPTSFAFNFYFILFLQLKLRFFFRYLFLIVFWLKIIKSIRNICLNDFRSF